MTNPAPFDVLSLSDLIDRVRGRLKTNPSSREPAYTLLVGSGFSFPLIPTVGGMLTDIPRWLFEHNGGARRRSTGLSEFAAGLWRDVHRDCAGDFALAGGLPDRSESDNAGKAYRAIMSNRSRRGLYDPDVRRQYLREAVGHVGNRVNGPHVYLASILAAQDTWKLGRPFCRTVFTTNFDALLQRALQLAGKLYYMTDRPEILDQPQDDDNEAIHLIYTHGSVHRYVLLNTEEEIGQRREENARALRPYFEGHGVIVIGYSGWSDSTMEALSHCRLFNGNLYWCDIHDARDAERRLNAAVLQLLRKFKGTAAYVPISGADDALRELHTGLRLGDTPSFIDDPIAQSIANLGVNLSSVPRAGSSTSVEGLEQVLRRSVKRLELAHRVFRDPSLLSKRALPQAVPRAAGPALTALRMSQALAAADGGQRAKAIRLWDSVVEDERAPAEERATAILNRAITYGEKGDVAREKQEYHALIRMDDAPADLKALAHIYLGVTYGEEQATEEEVREYDLVIRMRGIPDEQKALALVYRGRTLADAGRYAAAIKSFVRALGLSDIEPERKAEALLYRAVAYGETGKVREALADYSAVISMDSPPREELIVALNNRALLLRDQGRAQDAIADYDRLLGLPETASEDRADALGDRGWLYHGLRDTGRLIQDSRAALKLNPALGWVRFNLGLGLLLGGDTPAARREYRKAAREATAPGVSDGAKDLEAAIESEPRLRGVAEPILETLRQRARTLNRIP